MVIIETSIFTKQVQILLSDEEYRLLQAELANRPDLGPVIPGSGGLRKARWSMQRRGKRGGAPVLYYWSVVNDPILMLLIYSKNVQDDLNQAQLKMLRQIVEGEFS